MLKYVMVVVIGATFLLDPFNLRIGSEGTAQADDEGARAGTRAVPQYAINQLLGNADKDSSLHYVTSHSCINNDSTPPATPTGIVVSKVSFLRKVGPLTPPTVAALPLTNSELRPGWVILRVGQLAPNFFTSPCATPNNDCLGPDRYVVEESSTSNATGLAVIATQNFTYSTSSFDLPVFRGLYGQSRFYRIRFYPGGKTMNGCVLDTNVTQAQIPEQVRVRIVNHLGTDSFSQYTDQNIVRIRIGPSLNLIHTGGATYEKLARGESVPNQPQPMCAASMGVQVPSQPAGGWPGGGGTEVLDDGSTTTPGRYVHVGLGNWAYSPGGLEGCANNWLKRPYFLNPNDGTKLIHRFVEFDLKGRFGTTVIDINSDDSANRVIVISGTNSGLSVPSENETLPTIESLPGGNADPINPRY
jgi:hypothetical protein